MALRSPEERAARELLRKIAKERASERRVREMVTTGSKLVKVEAPVLGKRRTLTPGEKARVHEEHDGQCHVCGADLPLSGPSVEYDHITERRFRGTEELSNFAPICRACHLAKNREGSRRAAKADRQRKSFNGEKATSARKIQSPGFDQGYRPLKSPGSARGRNTPAGGGR